MKHESLFFQPIFHENENNMTQDCLSSVAILVIARLTEHEIIMKFSHNTWLATEPVK